MPLVGIERSAADTVGGAADRDDRPLQCVESGFAARVECKHDRAAVQERQHLRVVARKVAKAELDPDAICQARRHGAADLVGHAHLNAAGALYGHTIVGRQRAETRAAGDLAVWVDAVVEVVVVPGAARGACSEHFEVQVRDLPAAAELQALDEHRAAAPVGRGVARAHGGLVGGVGQLRRVARVDREAPPPQARRTGGAAGAAGGGQHVVVEAPLSPHPRHPRDGDLGEADQQVDFVGVGGVFGARPALAALLCGGSNGPAIARPPDLPRHDGPAGHPGDGLAILNPGDAKVFDLRALHAVGLLESPAHGHADGPAVLRARRVVSTGDVADNRAGGGNDKACHQATPCSR